jgi:RNA polymerase sigma-B factor
MNSRTGAFPRSSTPCRGRGKPLPLDLQRRNALVEAHRHLVPPLACHYWLRCQEPREDLTQVGLLGLIRAAELYRQSLQTPFSAFARPHIRGAILHYLRDDAASVRLPRRQSELQTRLARLEETAAMTSTDPLAATTELLDRLGMTREQWRLLRRHRQLCRPTPLEGDLLNQVANPEEDTREEDRENLSRLEALVAELDPRSQQVLRWVVVQGWSYRKAAAALEVSVMTVQRCLHKSLATLREQLQEAPRPLSPGGRVGRAPSAARAWPSRHSPPPAAAPARLSRP